MTSFKIRYRPGPGVRGNVLKVHDGDGGTLEIDGKPLEFRLFGVDAPEMNQKGGREARAALAALVLHKQVQVTRHERDSYGRTVVELRGLDGYDVGRLMVHAGHAWWLRRFAADRADLAAAEASARAARRGLWARDDAIAPWLWRGIVQMNGKSLKTTEKQPKKPLKYKSEKRPGSRR